ncbi:hypothetical protein PR202_gn00778 [Eleusine coracana subsp. coracana]|uniref:L-gulonolactone oxidase n=1 Tax=Eleusine coracana subsp. coracana TaxID=191504 RepID=A0AAV5G3A3_ELECO|nr:hypothetical protein PR202_gn00778 [Eleusine coracana subsp. coracana]
MAAAMRALFLLLPWLLVAAGSSTPLPRIGPVKCSSGMLHNCTVSNAYGTFNDRNQCRAAEAVYPTTEAELVAAVASAVREKRKVKASTAHSHSFPKLACPSGGGTGTVISTARLNRVVSIDAERNQITVESGMIFKDLIDAAAAAGMALPNSPYFYGLTVGGLLATGAHGSSLMRKGGAVHEHVVKVRIVTPAPPSERSSERLAVVREIGVDDPDLNAAKVSLGVLGVISQVTLQLDPLFKRSLTILTNDSDADLVELVSTWGHKQEFGDMYWLPGQRKVLLGQIDRVDVSTPGDGLNQAFFPPRPISDVVRERSQEDQLQELGSDDAFCQASSTVPSALQEGGFGFLNDGKNFTGYPVVGYNHKMQASGSCIFSPEDGPEVCVWNPRINGTFVHDSAVSVTLAAVPAFISDLMRLRDRNPKAFCTLDLHLGILFRYIKRFVQFLDVKARFDPDGVFSSQWSDQILGINGSPVISTPGCAVEGLCTCTQDSDCAPGYVCSQGKVYPDARNFTGYPVVGYNHKMQASGSCIFSPEDGPEVCVWNPRINGTFVYDTALSVALCDAPAFVSDLMRLRDRNPKAFCSLDLHLGILFRYIKGSTAYLGKARDSVEFDMIYYRSREPGRPVLHADLTDEIEQIALYKYGGLPHWGKKRNYVFNDTVGKFPKLGEFLDVKARFDPDGIFSSQWSDQVLGINGSPVISGPGCAVEGLCTCTKDSECAPGYLCSNGKVYPDARVCTVPMPQ